MDFGHVCLQWRRRYGSVFTNQSTVNAGRNQHGEDVLFYPNPADGHDHACHANGANRPVGVW
jgi:hypothetical protein